MLKLFGEIAAFYAIGMAFGGIICIPSFNEDSFRHSSNINVVTITVWKASVLVLLIGEIYK
jgi:hypothetical protein